MTRTALAGVLVAAVAWADRMPVPPPQPPSTPPPQGQPTPPPPPPPPPVPEVSITSVTTRDQTSLTPRLVTKKIASSYVGGMKRCYQRVLAKVPDATGTARLTFTVNAVGKVTAPGVSGFDKQLTRCVGGLVRSWRFPIPQSKYAEPTNARFAVAVQFGLVPRAP